jgi:hypothetical protein
VTLVAEAGGGTRQRRMAAVRLRLVFHLMGGAGDLSNIEGAQGW